MWNEFSKYLGVLHTFETKKNILKSIIHNHQVKVKMANMALIVEIHLSIK